LTVVASETANQMNSWCSTNWYQQSYLAYCTSTATFLLL